MGEDDFVISLSDGENETEWNLASHDLCGEDTAQCTSDEMTLGDLSIVCEIRDLQGNGLANTGDTIEVSVIAGDTFDPVTEYTIAIVHVPTGAEILPRNLHRKTSAPSEGFQDETLLYVGLHMYNRWFRAGGGMNRPQDQVRNEYICRRT